MKIRTFIGMMLIRIIYFLRKLIAGDYSLNAKKPGSAIKKARKQLSDEWNNRHYQDFFLERIVRLALILQSFVFPGLYIREISGRYGLKCRKISLEFYAIAKMLLPIIIILQGWYIDSWTIGVCIYLSVETILYLLSLVFLSGIYTSPISYKRSLITLFVNYIEVSMTFAVIYAYLWQIEQSSSLSYIRAVYFSIITATTIGFGDIVPNTSVEQFVVIIQSLISLIFVGMFFSYFLSHINETSYINKKR